LVKEIVIPSANKSASMNSALKITITLKQLVVELADGHILSKSLMPYWGDLMVLAIQHPEMGATSVSDLGILKPSALTG
jgi:hypothetical protein